MRPLLRRQNALLEAEVGQRLHLQQTLLGRQFRIRHAVLMLRGGLIAKRQSSVMMGQAHQTIEIDFIS
ncbi:hypothetical protein D3C79_793580 [compost metagenome]